MNFEAVQHKFDHAVWNCRWKWRKGEKGATLTFKIINENCRYTIPFSEKATATGVLFFLGSCISSFCLHSLSQSVVYHSVCACLRVSCTNVSCCLRPLGMNDVAVGLTKLGRNWAWMSALPTCFCFKACMIIWHVIQTNLNLRVLVAELLTRESQHWKSFYSKKENLMRLEKMAREEQKWQQLGWWVKTLTSSPKCPLLCAFWR